MTESRNEIATELLAIARQVEKRDKWFIGGFLGAVASEWNRIATLQTAVKNGLTACNYHPHNLACTAAVSFRLIQTDTGKEFGSCSKHIPNYRDVNARCGREVFVIIDVQEKK